MKDITCKNHYYDKSKSGVGLKKLKLVLQVPPTSPTKSLKEDTGS